MTSALEASDFDDLPKANIHIPKGVAMDRRSFMWQSAMALPLAVGGSSLAAASAESTERSDETHSPKTFQMTQSIPVEDGYDVAIAGGGPAGVAAAVCAARLGLKVFLAEAMGCFGGMGTSGLVCAYDPMADGEKQLVRGFMGEVVETMYEEGYMASEPTSWREKYHSWSRFNPEGYKYVLDRKVAEAGVKFRFFTRVVSADVDPSTKTVKGIITSNVEGFKYIRARAFIDCTGDAVLADLCGADYWQAGRDTPNIMPSTMPTVWSGTCDLENNQLRRLYFDATEAGRITHPSKKLVGLSQIDNDLFYLNGGHLFDLNAVQCDSLSEGMMRGRVIAHDFEKLFDSAEEMDLTLVATSSLLGVRETRRIKGEYVLNKEDLESRRLFPDSIGVYCKAADIHPYAFTDEAMADHHKMYYGSKYRPRPGEMFALPYGILVPRGWKNLWTAGRCASTDLIGQGSLRCQPYCSQMGQAAGTAAAQAIAQNETADQLDTERLVKTLREHDVYLPQATLSAEMTRM